MIAKVRHGRTRGTSHSPGCGSSDLFPFDAILVSALQVACSVLYRYLHPVYYTACARPVHRVHDNHVRTRNPRPRVCQLATSNRTTRALTGPALSLRRLCYLQQSGTHSTRCACKRDGLICVRVSQSNRAVAAATRVSFQRRPIANVRRDLGTVRFVASRIDLRFSSVAIGHMIS